MKKGIYFDHAATTPLDIRVKKAMLPYLDTHFGNPSSLHQTGQAAQIPVIKAQKEIANALGAHPLEIFFTSGATESNNWALQGVVRAWKKQYGEVPHLIISPIEHPSVLDVARALEEDHQAELTLLPVSNDGIVSLDRFSSLIRPHTALVSVMMVNNELGTIQPIREIGMELEKINQSRERKILFHVDAVQAFGYLPLKVEEFHIDLLSLSLHKLYGPKGIGILYIKENTPVNPLLWGGGQQLGMRPGTIPSFLIAGAGEAIRLAEAEREKNYKKVKEISTYFRLSLMKKFQFIRINSPEGESVPHVVNFSLPFGGGESLMIACDLEGIALSTGSACSSGSTKASHVLSAINIPEEYKQNSLRVSFGKENTLKEVNTFLEIFKSIIERMKALSL